jgi:hypothetical protein
MAAIEGEAIAAHGHTPAQHGRINVALRAMAVGLVWGSTNAALKRLDDDDRRRAGLREGEAEGSQALARELQRACRNARWVTVYLANQCGSLLFYYLLSTAEMSLVVPATQAFTVMFTAIFAYVLHEKGMRDLPLWRLICGVLLICGGIVLL